jgi:hypothetical protein
VLDVVIDRGEPLSAGRLIAGVGRRRETERRAGFENTVGRERGRESIPPGTDDDDLEIAALGSQRSDASLEVRAFAERRHDGGDSRRAHCQSKSTRSSRIPFG